MTGFLAIIGVIYVIYKLVSEAGEEPYEPGCIHNSLLFNQDMNKVRFKEMSQRELDRNIREGKYRWFI